MEQAGSGSRLRLRVVPDAHLSSTIDLARILLIVGLVFLHYGMYPNFRSSPFRGASIDEYAVATFVNSYLLFFFFSVVPLLSIISGWLYFRFMDQHQGGVARLLGSRVRRRFSSLFIPLVTWNAIYLGALLLVFSFDPANPLLKSININFSTADAWDYVNSIFAISHHPIAFQFWFVRDLFLTVLLSPLLWWSLRNIPILGATVLLVAWLLNFDFGIFFRPDVLFFFYVGGLIRVARVPLGLGDRATICLLFVYLALVAVRTAAPYFLDEAGPLLGAATRAMRLVGVLACWGVFLHCARYPWGKWLAGFGNMAFFLYAAHFPLMAALKLVLWNAMPEFNDFWMVAHYLVSVLVTVLVCLTAAVLLSRCVPRLFALLNGGRAMRRDSPSEVDVVQSCPRPPH